MPDASNPGDRVINLPLPRGAFTRSLPAWPAKSAAGVLDYAIETVRLNDELFHVTTPLITGTVEGVGQTGSLVASYATIDGTRAKFRLRGGIPGEQYTISIDLVFKSGQRIRINTTILILPEVLSPSELPVPDNALTLDGLPLDVDGFPIIIDGGSGGN